MKFILYIYVILFLFGCSVSQSDESNVFRYNESNGITSLDPAFARDLEIMWATNQIFDGLVEMNEDLEVVPCIAKSWNISEDGKTYTFIIRDSVFFHTSPLFADSTKRKVTAHDFAYSFSRIINPALASPGSWIFSKVDTSNNNGFEAINDSTFSIHLKNPFQPFLGMLTMQYCNVVPKEVVEHYGADFRSHPIGTGPFRFAFWYENIALVFHKNKNFWQKDESENALPYLDAIKIDFVKDMSVEYQGLLMNKYDFMSGIHNSYKDELLSTQGELNDAYKSKFDFYKMPFIKTDYLGFMIDPKSEAASSSPFLNSKVRKAIECAIDKKEMVRYLRNNTVVAAEQGFIPPGLLIEDSLLSEFNIQKSMALLSEAGYPNGKGLPEFTVSTTGDYADLIEYIQHSLNKIGLKVKVQVMQGGTFREATSKGQLAVFRKSWLADYADPENFFSLFLTENFCPNGPNYCHYSNTEFDILYNKAITTSSEEERNALYKEMNRMISEETPMIPLYYDQVSHFVSKSIENWNINPINLIDLKKVRKKR